jgi:hypothetical protein
MVVNGWEFDLGSRHKKHFIGTTAALIAGGLAAGSVGSAAIASHAGGKAADAQVQAANQAANIQHQDQQDALNFNKQVYANDQATIDPWIKAGQGGLANLQYLMGLPIQAPSSTQAAAPVDPFAKYQGRSFNDLVSSGDPLVSPDQRTTDAWRAAGIPLQRVDTADGRWVDVRTDQMSSAPPIPAASTADLRSLVNPSLGAPGSLLEPFKAPDQITEQNDPGYQFRLQEGQKALERSAAARGGLLSGGTAKELTDYQQNAASNEYGKVYDRAFGTFQTNQTNLFNRLAAISGVGQQAVTTLGQEGGQAAGTNASIDLTSGRNIGDTIQNAGNARASGYLNSGNIWGNAISGSTNNLLSLYLLSKMGKKPNSSSGSPYDASSFPGI